MLRVKPTTKGEITPPFQVFTYKAGQPRTYQTGDIILVRHNTWIAKAIRFGERLRYRGNRKQFAYWNHAAIMNFHKVYQAEAKGIVKSEPTCFDQFDVAVIRLGIRVPEELALASTFATWAIVNHEKYAWFTIVGIVMSLLTGLRLTIGTHKSMICSAFAARYGERLGFIPIGDPMGVLPADLAYWFQVPQPK